MSTSSFLSRAKAARRPRRTSARRWAPSFEPVESRLLLATNAFLQGVSFVDNGNGVLDAADTRLAGAKIALWNADQTQQLGEATTDANGFYFFNDSNGTVYSNDLESNKTYLLVQTPPSGYLSSSAQVQSQVYPAGATAPDTIRVGLTSTNALEVKADFQNGESPFNRIQISLDGTPRYTVPTQLRFKLTGDGAPPDPLTTPFATFCVEIGPPVDDSLVIPNPIANLPGSEPANYGRIAYLFNNYSELLRAASTTPSLLPASLQALLPSGTDPIDDTDRYEALASGMQTAIWTLEYGSRFQLTGTYDTTYTNAAAYQRLTDVRDWFLADSVDKNELALYLDTTGTSPEKQGIIAKGSFNFANIAAASLGDFVWEDADGNGVQDAGEAGIPGVKVELLNGSTVIATTTTDADGAYKFTDLAPGSYSVQFTAPAGYVFTGQDAGLDAKDSDANTVDGKTGTNVLTSGQYNDTVDAGLYRPVSVGDFVWDDLDGDGVQDTTETGINGVTLTLTGTTGAGAPVTLTTATSGNGGYLFGNLPPGTYAVTVDAGNFAAGGALIGYLASPTLAGGDTASDSNPSPSVTTPAALASNTSDLTLDFGFYLARPAIDLVKLTNGTDNNSPTGPVVPVGSTVTWTYIVTNPGNVPLTITLLVDDNGTAVTTDDFYPVYHGGDANSNNRLDTNETWTFAASRVATAGQYVNNATVTGTDATNSTVTDTDVDHYYGELPKGTISGKKYRDLTGNGKTSDDTALGGVKIYLDLNNDNVFNGFDICTTTAANGTYSFSGLVPGSYTVREVVPTGWIRTGPVSTDEYRVIVTAGSTSGGNDFANAEIGCECQISNIVYIINGCRQVSDLRGNVNQGDSVVARFTVRNVSSSNPATFSLVSYTAPDDDFVASQAYKQEVFDMVTMTYTSGGTYSLKVDVPNSYFQVDFVCGEVIDRFGPAGSNIFYTPQGRLLSADNSGSKAYNNAISRDDIGTVDFWCGTTGQNLIKGLNGSPTSKALGGWLSTNFSNLYGGFATKTNTQIAACLKSLKSSPSTALEAQILATALSVYVTDVDLADMAAYSAGFHVSFVGISAKTFDVGYNGSALGLSDRSHSLWTILKAADSKLEDLSYSNRSKTLSLFTSLNNAGRLDG